MPISQILLGLGAAGVGGGGGGGPVADFTVEWWQKVENSSNNARPWSVGLYPTQILAVSYESMTADYYWINSSVIGNEAQNHVGQGWRHMAFVRRSNVVYGYLNGTQYFTASNGDAITDTTTPLYVGTGEIAAGTYQGYITDLHIMKGYAKYTGNFSPPSSPVVGQDGSVFLMSSIAANNASVIDTIGSKNPSTTGTVTTTSDTPYEVIGPYTISTTAVNVPSSIAYITKTSYPETLNIRAGWTAESEDFSGTVVEVSNPDGLYYAVVISVTTGELANGEVVFTQPTSGSYYFNGSSYLNYGSSSDWAMDV